MLIVIGRNRSRLILILIILLIIIDTSAMFSCKSSDLLYPQHPCLSVLNRKKVVLHLRVQQGELT